MKVVFLGTPETAVASLDALHDAGHELPLVVCQPDRPVGRSRRPQAPPVKRRALELGLTVFQPLKVRHPSFRQRLQACAPDVLAVVAYGRILGKKSLALPRYGPVNVHFSLLPAYRGAAPVQWALVRGERVTGVTTMRMNERLDEGDVLLRREVAIEPADHAPGLQARLATIGAELLIETLVALESATVEPQPQEHAAATFAPPLERAMGQVDPGEESAPAIEGKIRGFDPWPGVWVRLDGRRVRWRHGRAVDGQHDAAAGEVLKLDRDGIDVACAGGSLLRLKEVQLEGRKPMGPLDLKNGRQLQVGDRFEPEEPA